MGGQNADVLLSAPFEVNVAGRGGEDREVSPQTGVLAGDEPRSPLSHDDRARIHPFSAKALDPEPFARTVMHVLC